MTIRDKAPEPRAMGDGPALGEEEMSQDTPCALAMSRQGREGRAAFGYTERGHSSQRKREGEQCCKSFMSDLFRSL